VILLRLLILVNMVIVANLLILAILVILLTSHGSYLSDILKVKVFLKKKEKQVPVYFESFLFLVQKHVILQR